MQTFLPLANFKATAKCLDWRRLGKQRVECLQILNSLFEIKTGWINHPATQMWKGYESSLIEYAIAIVEEWISRGYNDSTLAKFQDMKEKQIQKGITVIHPKWLGNASFHAAHRSNLLRKDTVYYGQFGWSEPPDLPYVWPTKDLG